MVLTLKRLVVCSIRAFAKEAGPNDGSTRWYRRMLRTVAHIDVVDDRPILFHRAMKTKYRLAKPHAADVVRGESVSASRPTGPASFAHRGRLKRTIAIRQSLISKHANS